jgi:hypothetical protein
VPAVTLAHKALVSAQCASRAAAALMRAHTAGMLPREPVVGLGVRLVVGSFFVITCRNMTHTHIADTALILY